MQIHPDKMEVKNEVFIFTNIPCLLGNFPIILGYIFAFLQSAYIFNPSNGHAHFPASTCFLVILIYLT